MARRSYQQYCPLAHAFDLVGERWTLLIIRELQLGPRRFSDLQRGLPGLSPNLLSRRLRDLESWDLIRQQPLPPPARSLAYALTPSGQALNEALLPLARWGFQFLRLPIPDAQFLGAVTAVSAMRTLFRPLLAADETLSAEIHLAPDSFRLRLNSAELHIEQGFLPDAALVLHTDPKPLLGLAAGALSVDEAVAGDLLRIERGTRESAETFFDQFRQPAPN